MALNRLTEDVNVISKLDNYPPDDVGMTPDKLKSLFDKGSNTIKDFINDTLIPQLEAGYISSVEKTSGDGSAGTTDTYTITFHDGNTITFDIYNGADGVKGDRGERGKSLEFRWNGTQLGVRVEGETNYAYVNLRGLDGKDGINGVDGVDGKDGKDAVLPFDIWAGSLAEYNALPYEQRNDPNFVHCIYEE